MVKPADELGKLKQTALRDECKTLSLEANRYFGNSPGWESPGNEQPNDQLNDQPQSGISW
jgi:hypothetical protein